MDFKCDQTTFEQELDNIKPMGCFCALELGVTINGIELDYDDFGVKTDIDAENAPEYCCGDMQFLPFDEVKSETLKKYNINEEQYRRIQEKLDCLSFGACGWCE